MKIAYANVINVNREAFLKKLIEVSNSLNVHPSWLMIVIKIESGFNRKAINKTSGAVGLLQWIPKFVAPHLGWSSKTPDWLVQKRIMAMSGVEQLELIKKFLLPYRGRMTDVYQTYLGVFWPAALGQSESYIIGQKNAPGIKGKSYNWNRYLDQKYGNKDGKITLHDIRKFVDSFTPASVPVKVQSKTIKNEPRKNCPCCKRPL